MASDKKQQQQTQNKPPEPSEPPVDFDAMASLEYETNDTGVKQVVAPNFQNAPAHLKKRFTRFDAPMGMGPPTRSPVDPAYQTECREFLVEHDWEEHHPGLWRDPLTAADRRGRKEVTRMLPEKGGEMKPLEQLVVPPGFRLHTTEEAVGLQRVRLAGEEAAACQSPLERLDAAYDELDAVRKLSTGVSSELNAVRRRPIPNTIEGLKAELMNVRRIAIGAADALKAGAKANVDAA